MEIIAACIESGCYSAVFAVLLAFALRSHARRERYYRKVITELVAGLADLERVNVRLDLGFTKDSPNFAFNINEAF